MGLGSLCSPEIAQAATSGVAEGVLSKLDLVAIAGLVVSILLAVFVSHHRAETSRKLAAQIEALKFLSSMQTAEWQEARRKFVALRDDKNSDLAALAKVVPVVSDMGTYLNPLETLGVAIRKEVLDGDIVKETYGPALVKVWMDTQTYVKARRTVKKDPALYKNLQWLAEQWGR